MKNLESFIVTTIMFFGILNYVSFLHLKKQELNDFIDYANGALDAAIKYMPSIKDYKLDIKYNSIYKQTIIINTYIVIKESEYVIDAMSNDNNLEQLKYRINNLLNFKTTQINHIIEYI